MLTIVVKLILSIEAIIFIALFLANTLHMSDKWIGVLNFIHDFLQIFRLTLSNKAYLIVVSCAILFVFFVLAGFAIILFNALHNLFGMTKWQKFVIKYFIFPFFLFMN